MAEPSSDIRLRDATAADADLLLGWRNEAETRRQSITPGTVARDEHMAWLGAVLADKDRQLYVAEAGSEAVGTVRADLDGGAWVLSWMVAPEARGRGVGRRIVQAIIDRLEGEIQAKIKSDNPASLRIAERVGMHQVGEDNGLTLWVMNK